MCLLNTSWLFRCWALESTDTCWPITRQSKHDPATHYYAENACPISLHRRTRAGKQNKHNSQHWEQPVWFTGKLSHRIPNVTQIYLLRLLSFNCRLDKHCCTITSLCKLISKETFIPLFYSISYCRNQTNRSTDTTQLQNKHEGFQRSSLTKT